MIDQLERLEKRAGGPTAAARLLGVAYTSSYRRWKRGEAPFPKYIEASIRAHLMLSDRELTKLLSETTKEG